MADNNDINSNDTEVHVHVHNHDAPEIDPVVQRDREEILKKSWANSAAMSVAKVFTFLAGIMIPVAMMFFKEGYDEVTKSGVAGAAADSAFGVMGAALEAAPVAGIALGVAAAATAIAVTSDFIASRVHHASVYDNLEKQAEHMGRYTAKDLVEEIKKEASVHPAPSQEIYECNERSDGKKWGDVIAAEQQLVQQQPQHQRV